VAQDQHRSRGETGGDLGRSRLVATCTVGERTLAYRRTGAGPPLVVVNGFAATKDDWDPAFLDALAGEHELVLLDNRGVGESPDDGLPFTIENLATDVAGLIDALGLERPAVLGWSMGGFVTLALALLDPAKLSKLVLLSTSGGGELATPGDPDVLARLRDVSGTPREQASRLISLLFPPERAAAVDAEFGEVVAAARSRLEPDLLARQWEALEGWERRDASGMARISCPALVATGEEDIVFPAANATALANAIPGAWLARFPRSGHGFMADHPETLAGLINTFLDVD
jgi:pimeloyl-ACP methyl ester carboxylesterase